MDEIDADGRLRHLIPAHPLFRGMMVLCGAFVVFISTWELHPAVWPPNFGSPFFLFLILGAYSVGFPLIWTGIWAPSILWIVSPGRIELAMRNPFGFRRRILEPADVAGFSLREHESDGGPSTWSVVLTTSDGKRYETRSFGTVRTAEMFRDRVAVLFRS